MTPQQRPPIPPDIHEPNPAQGALHRYYIEEAHFYIPYFIGASLKRREEGVTLIGEFAEQFPDSKWAPEAMFNQMLWTRWNFDKDLYLRTRDTIAYANALNARYPTSIRARVAMGLMLDKEYVDFKPDPAKDALELQRHQAATPPAHPLDVAAGAAPVITPIKSN